MLALPTLADATGSSNDFTIIGGVITSYNGAGGHVTIIKKVELLFNYKSNISENLSFSLSAAKV